MTPTRTSPHDAIFEKKVISHTSLGSPTSSGCQVSESWNYLLFLGKSCDSQILEINSFLFVFFNLDFKDWRVMGVCSTGVEECCNFPSWCHIRKKKFYLTNHLAAWRLQPARFQKAEIISSVFYVKQLSDYREKLQLTNIIDQLLFFQLGLQS